MDSKEFNLQIPLNEESGTIIVPVDNTSDEIETNSIEPRATSGSFNSGGDSQIYLKFKWTQAKGTGSSTLNVDMYVWTQYNLVGSALSGSHLTVNGNKKSYTKSISGTGDKLLASHSVTVTHTSATSVAISGSMVWNGKYNGTSYTTISGSGSITLEAVTAFPKVKVNGTYKNTKACYIKVGGVYKAVKAVYVKVNGVYKLCK